MKKKILVVIMIIAIIRMFCFMEAQAGWDSTIVKQFQGNTADLSVIYVNAASGNAGNTLIDVNHTMTETNVLYNVNGLYPGAKANWSSVQENVGTLNAEYDGITWNLGGLDQAIKDDMKLKMQYWITDGENTILETGGVIEENYGNFGMTLQSELQGVILEPGEKLNLGLVGNTDAEFGEIKLDASSGNDTKGKAINVTLEIKWKIAGS